MDEARQEQRPTEAQRQHERASFAGSVRRLLKNMMHSPDKLRRDLCQATSWLRVRLHRLVRRVRDDLMVQPTQPAVGDGRGGHASRLAALGSVLI